MLKQNDKACSDSHHCLQHCGYSLSKWAGSAAELREHTQMIITQLYKNINT